MKLYSYWRSSASYRVRIALGLKGLSYEYVPVHLVRNGGEQHRPEYRAINPQGRVPVLAFDDITVIQSIAIMEWLEETHPEPALLPRDANGRARVRSLAQIIVSEIQPLQNLSVTQYLKGSLGLSQDQVNTWLHEWIGRGMEVLETRLAREPGTGRFCHGDVPGMADACLVPQCYAAVRFGIDPAAYPTIARIHAACLELPAFQQAAPERQPDAPQPREH